MLGQGEALFTDLDLRAWNFHEGARGYRQATHAEPMTAGVPIVLACDYKVVPTAQDIYPTRALDNNALIQLASRQAFARLLAQGWTDAMRELQPKGPALDVLGLQARAMA